VHKVKKKW